MNMIVTTSIISILFTFNSCVIGSPSHNGTDILERTSSAMNYVGCYSTIDSLTNETTHLYQSFGWCLDECVKNSATTFALRGYECFCGSRLPPASSMVPKGECDMVCPGFSGDNCGSDILYSVYTTGLAGEGNVAVSGNSTTSNVATSSETNNSSASIPAADEVDDMQSTHGHSNAALIAGVVGGVCGGAALVGGALLLWRWRSRMRIAQAGVEDPNGYYGDGGFGPKVSRVESRFDGEYLAECRKVNGSIDDFHDYSRRILKVTNPDR